MKNRSPFLAFFLLCAFALTSCHFAEGYKYKRLSQILKSGNDAFAAKQYDEAIRQYDAGLAIAPGEAVFLVNKSAALRLRGADQYNSSIQLTDEKAKSGGKNAAKADFQASLFAATEAIDWLKSSRPIPFLDYSYETERLNAYASRADALRILAANLDRARADEALAAMREYAEIEPDADKKLKTQLDAGKMLIAASKGEQAAVEYKKILLSEPENVEALLGAGLALAQSGEQKKLEASKQYLQRFIDLAPAGHPQIAVAQDILNAGK